MPPILVFVVSITDIVLNFNVSVETAAVLDGITFTPVHLPRAISLFGISVVISMENASSCGLVLFGADSQPVLTTNAPTDRYVYRG